MKAVLIAAILTVALPTAAAAHCYSIWHYKTPQRCGVARVAVRAQSAAIEAPPPVKPAPEPFERSWFEWDPAGEGYRDLNSAQIQPKRVGAFWASPE